MTLDERADLVRGLMAPITQMMMARAAGKHMARLMGYAAVPILMGPILGPVIAGAILQHASWRWLFLVNVPVARRPASCRLQKKYVEDATRDDVLDFMTYCYEQGLGARTVYDKVVTVLQLFKSDGRSGLMEKGDWPNYVDTIRPVYEPEDLVAMLGDVAGVSGLEVCDRSVHSDSNCGGRGQGAGGTSHRDHVTSNSRAGVGWRRNGICCLLCSATSRDYCSERTEQQQTKQSLWSATVQAQSEEQKRRKGAASTKREHRVSLVAEGRCCVARRVGRTTRCRGVDSERRRYGCCSRDGGWRSDGAGRQIDRRCWTGYGTGERQLAQIYSRHSC
jgi:hypothetical protein